MNFSEAMQWAETAKVDDKFEGQAPEPPLFGFTLDELNQVKGVLQDRGFALGQRSGVPYVSQHPYRKAKTS